RHARDPEPVADDDAPADRDARNPGERADSRREEGAKDVVPLEAAYACPEPKPGTVELADLGRVGRSADDLAEVGGADRDRLASQSIATLRQHRVQLGRVDGGGDLEHRRQRARSVPVLGAGDLLVERDAAAP